MTVHFAALVSGRDTVLGHYAAGRGIALSQKLRFTDDEGKRALPHRSTNSRASARLLLGGQAADPPIVTKA